MHLGWSSCAYPLDAADFASVPDYAGPAIPAADLPDDEVILLVRKGEEDCLLRGREAVGAAGDGTVNVRIVFVPTIGKWNIPFAMIRSIRDKRRFKGSRVYHIAPTAIRALRVERAVRTLENPQSRSGVDRQAMMGKLEASLREHGYDDSRPIDVMLCRSRGEDSLRQGHHRISACIAFGVPRMAIRFSAAAALSPRLWKLIGRVPIRFDVLKGALESSTGQAVRRILPLGDRPVPRQVIVVPERGGRYVLNLVQDQDVTVGIARAVMLPVMVAGAIALDIAVLKTACGERSLVAWSQFALAFLSSSVMAVAAFREPRGRAGYGAMAFLLFAMSAYELLRDVLDIDEKAIGLTMAALALVAGAGCAAWSWRTFKTGFRRIASSGGFPALPFGFVFVLGISKLVSSRVIWGSLKLTDHDVRTVKHVVEESTELFGYAVIASWALSFFLERLAYRGRR